MFLYFLKLRSCSVAVFIGLLGFADLGLAEIVIGAVKKGSETNQVPASFYVWLNEFPTEEVRFQYKSKSISDFKNPATPGEDFIPVEGEIVFNPGEIYIPREIIVPVLDDDVDDSDEGTYSDEFFEIEFFNPVDALFKNSELTYKIKLDIEDDDPRSMVEFGSSVKGFRSDERPVVRVPMNVFGQGEGERVMEWKTVDGSAMAGRDYEGSSGILNLKNGENWIEVPVLNEEHFEKGGYFLLEMTHLKNVKTTSTATKAGYIDFSDQFQWSPDSSSLTTRLSYYRIILRFLRLKLNNTITPMSVINSWNDLFNIKFYTRTGSGTLSSLKPIKTKPDASGVAVEMLKVEGEVIDIYRLNESAYDLGGPFLIEGKSWNKETKPGFGMFNFFVSAQFSSGLVVNSKWIKSKSIRDSKFLEVNISEEHIELNSEENYSMTMHLDEPLEDDIELTIYAYPPGIVNLIENVIIPAGQTEVEAPFSLIKNEAMFGPVVVDVLVYNGDLGVSKTAIKIIDSRPNKLSVEMPEFLRESEPGVYEAVVKIQTPITNRSQLEITLSATDRLQKAQTYWLVPDQNQISVFFILDADGLWNGGKKRFR